MDDSVAVALAGLFIAMASLGLGALTFRDTARRTLVEDLRVTVRDLEVKVAECKRERAEDEKRNTFALEQLRERLAAEVDDVRKDRDFWRTRALNMEDGRT